MAQAAWEKPIAARGQLAPSKSAGGRWKFLIGGGLILAAVVYLVISGTLTGAQYFMTINELMANPAYAGKTVRITGAVLGDSIQYDEKNLLITFTIANVPTQGDNLGQALHNAVTDPNATRLSIRVENTLKPELLKNEAQAILTGTLGTDGVFRATELNLKCPSKFIESGPSAGSVAPLQEETVKVGAGA
jgi:cytochrome c-type biogenesis protein CcmE